MKFDLKAAIRDGLQHFAANWRTAFRLSIGPLIGCYLALAAYWILICGAICADCGLNVLYGVALYGGWFIVTWVPLSLLLVNLARFGLLGEMAANRPLGLGWTRRETNVFLRTIAVQLPMLAIAWLIYSIYYVTVLLILPSSTSAPIFVGYLIFTIALLVMAVRVMLFSWSAALDQPMRFGAAWRQMRGRTLAVSLFSCGLYVPISLLAWFIQAFYFDRIMPLLYWAAYAGVYLLWGLLTVPAIFVAAECYRQIAGDPRPLPSPARTP